MIRAPYAALSIAALAACGGADDAVPITFTPVTDDRVPVVEQTQQVGGHAFWGPGAGAGDVDGDGRVDVYLSGGGLYLNRPDAAGFRLEPALPQPPAVDIDPLSAVFADYDRDGDLDLTLCGNGGVRLLSNDGAAGWSDVTTTAGVSGQPTDVCVETAWGDIDGDGHADLAVATYGNPSDPGDAQAGYLYLNRGDGTFESLLDPVRTAGMERRSIVTAFADFDGDGALDLYYGDDQFIELDPQYPRGDLVFLNRGVDTDGVLQLAESSAELGLDGFRATMGCAFGTPTRGPGWDVAFSDVFRIWLFHAGGPATGFDDVTAARGDELRGPAAEKWVMWGGQFADFDGDGFEDLLFAQAPVLFGEQNQELLGPALLRNREGVFERVRYAFGGPLIARGTLLADLDGDGDDDVIVSPLYGAFRFFVNDTPPRDYVRVELVATTSAPGAAGAVVTAEANGVAQRRMVVAGGRPFAAGPTAVVDFALPGADAMDVTVTWPSGTVQTVPGLATGVAHIVTEQP